MQREDSKASIKILSDQRRALKHLNKLCWSSDVILHKVLYCTPVKFISQDDPVRPDWRIPPNAQGRLGLCLSYWRGLQFRRRRKCTHLSRRTASASSNCACANNYVVQDVGIQWRHVELERRVSIDSGVTWDLLVVDSDNIMCDHTIRSAGSGPGYV